MNNNLITWSEIGKDNVLRLIEELEKQSPAFLRELCMWYGVSSFIVWLVFALGLAALLFYSKRCFRKLKEYFINGDNEAMLAIPYSLAFLVCSVVVFANLAWLQILIAPRLFIIEYISRLLGGKGGI